MDIHPAAIVAQFAVLLKIFIQTYAYLYIVIIIVNKDYYNFLIRTIRKNIHF